MNDVKRASNGHLAAVLDDISCMGVLSDWEADRVYEAARRLHPGQRRMLATMTWNAWTACLLVAAERKAVERHLRMMCGLAWAAYESVGPGQCSPHTEGMADAYDAAGTLVSNGEHWSTDD